MLFFLFSRHHILPSAYYALAPGERDLVTLMAERELDLLNGGTHK